MAGKRKYYVLTKTAEYDFRLARQWSLTRWGKQLTRQYFADLHRVAEDIGKNCQHYASVEYLVGDTELRIYPVREHYLVYLPINKNKIAIVALIRQSRDIPAILNASAFMIERQLKDVFDKLGKDMRLD